MPDAEYASQNRPCFGEVVSGDLAIIQPLPNGWFLGIMDVLGHGSAAHEVAKSLAVFLQDHSSEDVVQCMEELHQLLKGTRGAAVGLGFLHRDTGKLLYAGTGNTTLRKFGQREVRLISRAGVVGQNLPTPYVQEMPLEDGDLLVLHTDGIRSNFALTDYPQLVSDDPARIARTIVDHFGKDHDDATCLVLRYHHD